MKRLNLLLIAILSATVVVGGVGVYFLQRWQVDRHTDGLLRRADLAEEAGESQEAVGYLSRYVQSRPGDAQVFTRMALLVEQSTKDRTIDRREFQATAQLLEKAARLDPENSELRRRAAEYYLRFGRAKDATEHITAILGDGDDSELQYLLARAHIAGSKYNEASDTLSRIVGYSSDVDDFIPRAATNVANIQAYIMLAAIQREQMSNPILADSVMGQSVTANPQSAAARVARGRYLLRHYASDEQQLAQATSDIQRAAELAPNDSDVIMAMADMELLAGDLANAKSWLEKGMQRHPETEIFFHRRASVAVREENREEALRFIDAGLARLPESWPLLLLRADLDLASGNLQRARETAAAMRGEAQMRFLGDYINAQILLAERKWKACDEAIERVLPELMARRPDLGPPAYMALARCREQMGQPDRQREANRQLLELQPGSLAGHFSEARALLRLGRMEDAQREMSIAKRIAQRQGVESPEMKQWELTLLAAREQAKPKETRDIAALEEQFLDQLQQRDDLTGPVRAAMHVRFLLQQGQLPQAADVLNAALADAPQDEALLLAQVDLAQLQEGDTRAGELLAAAEQRIGDTLQIRLRRAMLLTVSPASESHEQLLALETNTAEYSDEHRMQLHQGLAAIHHNLGNVDDALRLWAGVAEQRPEDLAIRMNMFEVATGAGDLSTMGSVSQEIREIAGGESPQWKFTEATRLLLTTAEKPNAADWERARRLAREAQEQRPDWHALSLLQAELELRDGNVDAAIDNLQTALDQGPAAPHTIRKLVELLWSQQRFDEARTAMQRLGRRGEMSLTDVRIQSRAELAGGDAGVALALARRAAEASNSANDYLWLGRLLANDEKTDEAIAALRRAVELSPENEQARLLLLRHLLAAGRREQAEAAVREIQLHAPQDRADSMLGIAYEMLGQMLLAKRHFEQAAIARPSDPLALRDLASFHLLAGDAAQAEAQLERLLALRDRAGNDTSPHSIWARRTKAKLIGGSGKYTDYQKAIGLLQANAGENGLAAGDLLLWAELTMPRDDPYALRDAIAAFDEAANARALSHAERLAMARLHEAAGDWPRCESIMLSLIADASDNAAVIASWCDMKLRRKELSEVEQLTRQLDPNAPVTKRLRAHLLAAQGRTDRAAQAVQAMIPPPEDKNRITAVLSLARFLEEIELPAEAERFYRAAARQRPELRLRLAEFLARNGDLDEALGICDDELNEQSVMSVARIGIMALTTRRGDVPADSPQYERVKRWLERGLRDLPDSKALALHRAFFLELIGDYEQAISLYRSYLKRTDLMFRERAVAANNLAMILAGRDKCVEAKALIDEAIGLVGPTAAMLDTRAMVRLCSGAGSTASRAIEELQLALAVSREPVIGFHLAVAHHESGDAEAAEQALRNALNDGLNPAELSPLDRPRYNILAKLL